MNRSGQRVTGLLVLVILLLSVYGVAMAKDATLTNIIVTNTRDDLLVYLSVEGAFTQKMEDAVKNGVPASFTFFVNLYRTRSMWLDKKLADLTITHTIKYNSLKKEYAVSRSWDSNSPVILQSFDAAKKLMTEIDSLKVIPLGMLERGKQYQIQAKAKLSRVTLPYYLHYVLFFLSLWDFETDWYTIDFIY
jgi:glycerophosphoryl diester phosphodiesterase